MRSCTYAGKKWRNGAEVRLLYAGRARKPAKSQLGVTAKGSMTLTTGIVNFRKRRKVPTNPPASAPAKKMECNLIRVQEGTDCAKVEKTPVLTELVGSDRRKSNQKCAVALR